MRRWILTFVVLASITARAEAQPAREADERSPGVALALSGGITLGGIALTAYGSTLTPGRSEDTAVALGIITTAVGPTIGNIYAGDVWNAGLGMRLASVGMGLVGVTMIAASQCFIECREGSPGLASAGSVVFVGGMVLYGAGTVYEIGNAYAATRRHNARAARTTVVPVVTAEVAGVSLAGSF